MTKVVVDTTVLVSAWLRHVPGQASYDLLRLADEGRYELCLSDDILEETARVLISREHIRRRYTYTDADVIEYCQEMTRFATILRDFPIESVVRDPEDDMIVACALAADADYLVSRDRDLLSLGEHKEIKIVSPETFLHLIRNA